MWPKSLSELKKILNCDTALGGLSSDFAFSAVSLDSRKISSGQIFIPLKGEHFDGNDYIQNVLKISGVCVLASKEWFESREGQAIDFSKLAHQCVLIVEHVELSFRMLAAAFRQELKNASDAHALRCVVAIGGSNGKTTTKEMLVSMLGGMGASLVSTLKSENGYVGIPKTLCHPNMSNSVENVVLEVGIDENGAMQSHLDLVCPDIALLTSLSHEHLEGFGSFENVVKEELLLLAGPWVRIWQGTDPILRQNALKNIRRGDWLVLPCLEENPAGSAVNFCSEYSNQNHFDREVVPSQINGSWGWVLFSVDETNPFEPLVKVHVCFPSVKLRESANNFENSIDQKTFSFSQFEVRLPIPGRHHCANFACAFAAVLAIQCRKSRDFELERPCLDPALLQSLNAAVAAFSNFVPPDLRSHILKLRDGSVLLADCYNSNPASLKASLDFMRLPQFNETIKLLFLGDMLDLGTSSRILHEDLISELQSMPECQLYLYGEAMYDVYKQLQKVGVHRVLKHLPRSADPETWIAELFGQMRGSVTVLVKGSRGMEMERLIPALKNLFSSPV